MTFQVKSNWYEAKDDADDDDSNNNNNNDNPEDLKISKSEGSLPLPRVKRPSIALGDIFNAGLGTRLKWFVALSLPITVSMMSTSLIFISATFALFAGLATFDAVPSFGRLLLHAGRRGTDLNKFTKPIIPESLGIAVGTIFLLALFLFIPVPFSSWLLRRNGNTLQFPFEQLGAYTAALLSITCMLFLGFADDVLNLRWRHKILIPAMSSLPLLMIYCVTCGRTEVVVPLPLRSLFGPLVDLGIIYYVYMSMLAIFCTHSINILAGVNGVEVGQSVIIALSIVGHNLLALWKGLEESDEHIFSLTLTLPFLAVSLALLYHNWYPARVFVGDTYCYFAGMTFAVVGILGHFSKTLLLFFIPQVVNFLVSLPQLFGVIPCPRHRLPILALDGSLHPSHVTFDLTVGNRPIVTILSKLKLLKIYNRNKDEITTNNFTLLNILLIWFGPMREDRLAMLLMAIQMFCCLCAFLVRHHLSVYIFPRL